MNDAISPAVRERIAQAFAGFIGNDVAQDVIDEVMTAETVVEARVALRQVMRERGIVTENGLTRIDIRYLRSLAKENKPVAAGTPRQSEIHQVPA